jgi:tetratricopeptide (TPR) repeat protein
VARSLLDEGQTVRAVSTLENLICEDPNYADAYDVMGRAQFEQGKFSEALATYKMASSLTPASISRLQNMGLMCYYSGERKEAETMLDRTTRLGLDSKMFDCQTLVLLAFIRLESGDHKGLQRCRDDFVRLIERNPDSARHVRLAAVVDALLLIDQRQYAQVLGVVRDQCTRIKDPEFDFESATNLLSLLAQLANKAIQLDEVDAVVDALALRFAGSRALSELLSGAAAVHPPYAQRIPVAHSKVLKLAESAMTLSLKGDPKAAVQDLIKHGCNTLSSKLIETAYLVLHRHAKTITDIQALTDQVHELRTRYHTHITRPALGEQKRQAGGLTMRAGSKAANTAPNPVTAAK